MNLKLGDELPSWKPTVRAAIKDCEEAAAGQRGPIDDDDAAHLAYLLEDGFDNGEWDTSTLNEVKEAIAMCMQLDECERPPLTLEEAGKIAALLRMAIGDPVKA